MFQLSGFYCTPLSVGSKVSKCRVSTDSVLGVVLVVLVCTSYLGAWTLSVSFQKCTSFGTHSRHRTAGAMILKAVYM